MKQNLVYPVILSESFKFAFFLIIGRKVFAIGTAAAIFSASPGIKGNTPTVSELDQVIPVNTLSQATPNTYTIIEPQHIAITLKTAFRPVFSDITPIIYTAGKYPIRYPPVGPIIRPNPPVPPENTGNPQAPAKRYIATLAKPHLLPNKRPVRSIKKFCSTMGTGPMGIDKYAPAAVKAARSEAYAVIWICVDEFIFNILCLKLFSHRFTQMNADRFKYKETTVH
ncbi:MAG: hypothetical protein SRB1_01750 [Desulfobacteraceae bacterium Eth-SRB1]|nr:MAG: hypothetical protein SRB1_01750 [Desulfobacteraceae bacterium Eth-SRB1]